MSQRKQKDRQKAKQARQARKQSLGSRPKCIAALETSLPRIERHAQIQFRNVRCESRRDELVAETVAIAFRWWLGLWERGKDPRKFVSALATFAVRAARSGRRLTGMDRAKDVLSPRAQQGKCFAVVSLPCLSTLTSNPFAEALADNTKTAVDDQVAFRFDFVAWLGSWDAHRREIIDMMLAGERTTDIAARTGKSMGRISQMRQEFLFSWECFIEEEF